MNGNATIRLCNDALKSCKPLLSERMTLEISEYINLHNEWGLGMEFLIDAITEDELNISIDQFQNVQVAMVAMGLSNSERLEELKKCIPSTT